MIDIEAIKARLANGPEFESILPSETNELYCSFAELPYKLGEWDSVIYVPAHEDGGIPPVLTFIADAASDIAALIAEVEALRSESLTMRQWAEEAAAAENANAQELREARAEATRLRDMLNRMRDEMSNLAEDIYRDLWVVQFDDRGRSYEKRITDVLMRFSR